MALADTVTFVMKTKFYNWTASTGMPPTNFEGPGNSWVAVRAPWQAVLGPTDAIRGVFGALILYQGKNFEQKIFIVSRIGIDLSTNKICFIKEVSLVSTFRN